MRMVVSSAVHRRNIRVTDNGQFSPIPLRDVFSDNFYKRCYVPGHKSTHSHATRMKYGNITCQIYVKTFWSCLTVRIFSFISKSLKMALLINCIVLLCRDVPELLQISKIEIFLSVVND